MEERAKTELLASLVKEQEKAAVHPNDVEVVKKMGVQAVSTSEESDVQLIEDPRPEGLPVWKDSRKLACHVAVKSGDDEKRALALANQGLAYLVITCPNWRIIPLENLIATVRGKSKLIAKVQNPSEAKLVLETLELGVDGIIAECNSPKEVESYRKLMAEAPEQVSLLPARIVTVRQLGSGLRACVDTTEIMTAGEGILVGSKSSGLFLVEAEVHQNPHVAPRPFRVNAGAVSLYLMAEHSKTRYLSEIIAGDQVLIVNRSGHGRLGHVGRSKIERRPMVLVEAQTPAGLLCKALLQNAETIRLVTATSSLAVTALKPGDEVLVHVEEGGRHFGTLVKDETVIEQ